MGERKKGLLGETGYWGLGSFEGSRLGPLGMDRGEGQRRPRRGPSP